MPSDRRLVETAISLVKRNRPGRTNDIRKTHKVSWNNSIRRRNISRSLQKEAVEYRAWVEESSVKDLKLKNKVLKLTIGGGNIVGMSDCWYSSKSSNPHFRLAGESLS